MKTKADYLKMQRTFYDSEAQQWDLLNRDPVVGHYDWHNQYEEYDTRLFRGFDTTGKIALEYGCGPGRNLIRFKDRFARIDGVDIARVNLDKAVINIRSNGVTDYNLFLCNGESIPVADESYDVVFSVICLQHICSHTIRFNIMKDVYRVLKPEGYFCFQMGFGRQGNSPTSEYFEDAYDAHGTNSAYDVIIRNEDGLREDFAKIGFRNPSFYLGDPIPEGHGPHTHWIWIQAQK